MVSEQARRNAPASRGAPVGTRAMEWDFMWNKSSVTWQLFALRLLYIKGVMSRYADVEMSVNPKDHGAKGPNK